MDIEHLINIFGYPAVLLLVMGESMGVPLPGETALLLASAYSGMTGGLSLWGIMARVKTCLFFQIIRLRDFPQARGIFDQDL